MIDSLGFLRPYHVQGRTSIADLFSASRRCGIYILQFSNGEFYAGLATDVTRRYIQHCKVHGDIEKIYFKKIGKRKLKEEERAVIWSLEQSGYQLRNITFTSMPKGDSDFDFVMSPSEQDKWLKDLNYVDTEGDRPVNPELRRKYNAKFRRFASMSQFNEVVRTLQCYAAVGIPAIRRSEISFWSCSCLPSPTRLHNTIYTRVNIFWQEVFTAYEHEGELWFSLHLALSPLEKAFGPSLSPLLNEHTSLEVTDHYYEPGGQDQINLEIPGAEAARKLIREASVSSAIRLFNLRLMKKGPCIFGRYHCMDLADMVASNSPEE
jgi:hypothetical protein